MSDRFDLCVARPRKDGKVYWHKIGSAFSNDKGGFDLTFDSLPVPEYSDQYGLQVRAKAFPAKPRDDVGGSQRQRAADQSQSPHNRAKADGYQPQQNLNDEIPFK